MRKRIYVCIIFIFACWLTSANLTKAQGEKATVGSPPIVKKPAAPPKKTATVKPRATASVSKANTAKKAPSKTKNSSQRKSAAKIANEPESDVESAITVQDNNSAPGGAGLGGESMKACSYYLGSGLYDKWVQMGGESGRLGCPIMNESDAARSPQGTTGRMTQFSKGDGGYIIWHGSGSYSGTSFEVSGCMFKLYSSLGGTASWLGFPVKDGYNITGGARQDFEGGYILWDSKTYVCTVYRY